MRTTSWLRAHLRRDAADSAELVALFVLHHMETELSKDGEPFASVSINTLCMETGKSRNVVRDALRRLCEPWHECQPLRTIAKPPNGSRAYGTCYALCDMPDPSDFVRESGQERESHPSELRSERIPVTPADPSDFQPDPSVFQPDPSDFDRKVGISNMSNNSIDNSSAQPRTRNDGAVRSDAMVDGNTCTMEEFRAMMAQQAAEQAEGWDEWLGNEHDA